MFSWRVLSCSTGTIGLVSTGRPAKTAIRQKILEWTYVRPPIYGHLKPWYLHPVLWTVDVDHIQGHNHGWKVEGDQGLGPNTRALAPRARPKTGLGVGCGRGSPGPPAVRVRGYHPGKIFENSDAKSCILVTSCCEISCFLKTTAKKLGDQ